MKVSVEASQYHRPAEKRKHPAVLELVGGADLTPKALRERPECGALAELLSNAEYWLAFDVASFEPLLARCPSPLRELGVGVALKFAEGIDGQIARGDIEAARAVLLPDLAPGIREGVEAGLESLLRGVEARDAVARLEADGFAPYAPSGGISIAGLRAAGRATILADGETIDRDATVPIGAPIELRSADDRGKPLAPPEVESDLGAPLLGRTEDGARTVVILVPGRYRLRVPGRSEAVRTILAR